MLSPRQHEFACLVGCSPSPTWDFSVCSFAFLWSSYPGFRDLEVLLLGGYTFSVLKLAEAAIGGLLPFGFKNVFLSIVKPQALAVFQSGLVCVRTDPNVMAVLSAAYEMQEPASATKQTQGALQSGRDVVYMSLTHNGLPDTS